jgi:NADH:ubiquinone reductase (H+-translocating)
MMRRTMQVVVVGGGYAGVMAANRLAGMGAARGVQVTLVDPGEQFTERIRLHEVAAGNRGSAGVEWERVLHPQVRRLPARAVRIDAEGRTVTLVDHEPLGFDRLVYAVGSGEQPTSLLSVTSPAATATARRALAELPPGSTVTVAGAGPTGVEVACAVAVSRPDLAVTVVAPSGPGQLPAGRPAVACRMESLGVTVVDGTVDPTTGVVSAADGRARPVAAATVWTAGLAVPALAADSGLPVAEDGRLLVDATLTVPGYEHVLGAGDAVAVQGAAGAHLRPSCASALPLGAHAAEVVLARLAGTAPARVDIGYLLQCLDLGGGHGHVQTVHPDDTVRRWALTGRAGGWAKEKVCRSTLSWLAGEARRPGSYSWPSGPSRSVG